MYLNKRNFNFFEIENPAGLSDDVKAEFFLDDERSCY